MTTLQYCLSSNSYKNKIFAGFSQLQKDEELVDLTLAADGCFVKVHRNIISLASPYLRQILRTISDHSPVIFLHNINQKILSYILEYIYQGVVNIPVESVDAFIEVSKSLHIAGIEDLEPPKELPLYKLNVRKEKPPDKRAENVAAHITISDHTLDIEELPQTNSCNIENLDFYSDCNINESSNINNITDLLQIKTGTSQINPAKETDRANNDWINNAKINIQQSNHTESSNQVIMKIEHDIPVIEITNDHVTTDLLQTHTTSELKDYTIILKSQENPSSTETATQNVPTIVIQPIEFSNQQYQNTFEGNTHIKLHGNTNATMPTLESDSKSQNAVISRSNCAILDDRVLNRANRAAKNKKKLMRKARTNSDENHKECIAKKTTHSSEVSEAMTLDSIGMDELKNIAQYSVTERGALQLILNRFIYCCHHSSRGVRKRRWRCVDYRHKGCPAMVDTMDGDIVARKGIHNHHYHDGKIYKKNKNNLIYRTMLQAIEDVLRKEKDAKKLVLGDEIDELISDE